MKKKTQETQEKSIVTATNLNPDLQIETDLRFSEEELVIEERKRRLGKKEELRFFEAFYIRFFQSHVSSGYGYNMNWGSSEYHIDDVIDFDNFDISDVHFPAYYNDVNSKINEMKVGSQTCKQMALRYKIIQHILYQKYEVYLNEISKLTPERLFEDYFFKGLMPLDTFDKECVDKEGDPINYVSCIT